LVLVITVFDEDGVDVDVLTVSEGDHQAAFYYEVDAFEADVLEGVFVILS